MPMMNVKAIYLKAHKIDKTEIPDYINEDEEQPQRRSKRGDD